jgi:membrane-bound serine protease (ClpP class)
MTFVDTPLFSNLLYLLLVAGLWLAALAVVSPGTGVLEVLAFFALAGAGFGTLYLPLNGWAIVFLVIGTVLLIMALRLPREELWLGLSAVAFCVGSVFLFRLKQGGPAVHPLVAISTSVLTLAYFWVAVRNAIAAHKSRPSIDASALMGKIGEVRTALNPTGSIYVAGELWTARADSTIDVGSKVKVKDRNGLILLVELVEEP